MYWLWPLQSQLQETGGKSVSGTVDDFYLQAIIRLGNARGIITNRDIYSEDGHLILAKGFRISARLYGLMLNHKLSPPIEECLITEGMVDRETVLDDIKEMLRKSRKLKQMAEISKSRYSVDSIVSGFNFSAELAFKLTVVREEFKDIYRRGLSGLIVSSYLAHCDGMQRHQCIWIAMAALFRDVGLLHINPQWLAASYTMTVDERQHLYAHPLTSYLFLQAFSGMPGDVIEAVLEHHECNDGSGYPRGVAGDRINRYGKILALAEITCKSFESDLSRHELRKLEVILKLGIRRYERELVEYILPFTTNDGTGELLDSSHFQKGLEKTKLLLEILINFNHHGNAGETQFDEVYIYARKKIDGLTKEFHTTGIDLNNMEYLIEHFEDDPESIAEYLLLLDEIFWQLRSLVLGIFRVWKDVLEKNGYRTGEGGYYWLKQMKQALKIEPTTNKI